jgi:HlyD family secretion protein
MKKISIVILILALAGAGYWFFGLRNGSSAAPGVQYRTAKVERGEVIEGVTASGTVQPVVLVQVGTQISGAIEKLFADFNSQVKAGQTIALLDARRLAAQVASDDAAVARAQADLVRLNAAVKQSQAEVERIQAQLTQAERDLERQKTLAERKLISPADLDTAVATRDALAAQLGSSRAAVEQSQAQVAVGEAAVKQAQAQLASDKVNLDYATIVSPVDGTVVSRNVDVGQTVAASLQAPTLFLIAQDLTKIQVQVSVPEAEIGKIHKDQPAHFTVDAYGERSFDGSVSQVRLASTTVQNVVTYTVVVDASNPEGLLFPGMTATLTFEIARSKKDALHVPVTALRVQPTPELLESAPPAAAADGEKPATSEKPEKPEKGAKRGAKGRRYVYLVGPTNRLRAVPVRAGISDLLSTTIEELEPGSLPEGTEVVTAILRDAEAATTNPFAPPRIGGGRNPR